MEFFSMRHPLFFIFFFSLRSVAMDPKEEALNALVGYLKTSSETASRKAELLAGHFRGAYLQEVEDYQQSVLDALRPHTMEQRYDVDLQADFDLVLPSSPKRLNAGVEKRIESLRPLIAKATAEITRGWAPHHKDEFDNPPIQQLLNQFVHNDLQKIQTPLSRKDSGIGEDFFY